jgi:hypothetical protein
MTCLSTGLEKVYIRYKYRGYNISIWISIYINK